MTELTPEFQTAASNVVTVAVDIFVAVDERAAANVVLNLALGQAPEANNFVRDLSPAGTPPATAYGSFGAYSAAQWETLRNAIALAAPQIPSIRYYVRGFPTPESAVGNRLLETNSSTATASIGLAWTPATSFNDAGVVPIVVNPFI